MYRVVQKSGHAWNENAYEYIPYNGAFSLIAFQVCHYRYINKELIETWPWRARKETAFQGRPVCPFFSTILHTGHVMRRFVSTL
jgi:hypothetical protein